jgi:hypothetical protein
MTTRISIVRELPMSHWEESHFSNEEPANWHTEVAFLRRLWQLGEDTIMETAFYEPFQKPDHKFTFFEISYLRD